MLSLKAYFSNINGLIDSLTCIILITNALTVFKISGIGFVTLTIFTA